VSQAFTYSAEYAIFHSGLEMIVHRLVKCPAPDDLQYYLEASPTIPIDSQEYPHLAVLAAILFHAGMHPFTPFVETPLPSPRSTPSPVRNPFARPWTPDPLKVLVTMWTYLESKSYSSDPSYVFDWGSRTVSFYYTLRDFFSDLLLLRQWCISIARISTVQ
jgi:hypothetical protein